LKAKSEMELISLTDLKKNDLVLLEAKINHYRAKDPRDEKWGQHAQLEMTAISLLHSPDSTDEDEWFTGKDIDNLWI
jgi:hypothetical protein